MLGEGAIGRSGVKYIDSDQMSFFSVNNFWMAASPCPLDLTKPEIVRILDLSKLIVPSALTLIRGMVHHRWRVGWRSGLWR